MAEWCIDDMLTAKQQHKWQEPKEQWRVDWRKNAGRDLLGVRNQYGSSEELDKKIALRLEILSRSVRSS